jgi:hypothetical protein
MRAFLVTILVLVGLGFYQDWLHPADGRVKEYTGQAKERQQSLGGVERQSRAKENETTLGWVKKIETADNCFVMTTIDNEKLTVHMDQSTTLKLNNREITLADIEVGDEVRVAYDIRDGKIVATSITVDRK